MTKTAGLVARLGTLVVNPITHTTVYAAGSENQSSGPPLGVIYRTTNGGTNWTRVMTSNK